MPAPEPPRATLELEIALHSEPIEGLLHVEGLPDRPFCGWLDFTTAIQEWRRAAADRAPPRSSAGPD